MYPPQVTEVTMNKVTNQINAGRKKNRPSTNYSNQQQNNNSNKIHQSNHHSSNDNQTNLNPFQQRNSKYKSKSNRRNNRLNNENHNNTNYQNFNNNYSTDKPNSNKFSLDNRFDRFDFGNKPFYGNYHHKQFNGKQFDKSQWLEQQQFGCKIDVNKYPEVFYDEFERRDKQIVNKQSNKQLEREQRERQFYEKKQIDKQNKRLQEIEDAMKENQKNIKSNNESNQQISAHQSNQLNTNQILGALNPINFAPSILAQLPIDENEINLQNQINKQIDNQFKKQQLDSLSNTLISTNSSLINTNGSPDQLMNDSLLSNNLFLDKSMNNMNGSTNKSLDRSIGNSSGKSFDKSLNKPNRAITKHNGNGSSSSTIQKLPPAGTGLLMNGFCTNINNDLIPITNPHQFTNIDLTNGHHHIQNNSHLNGNRLINNGNSNNGDQFSNNQAINGQFFNQLIKNQLINNSQFCNRLPPNFNINDLKNLNKNLEDSLNASLNASKAHQMNMIPNGLFVEFNNNNLNNSVNKVINNEPHNQIDSTHTNHLNKIDQSISQSKNLNNLEPAENLNEQNSIKKLNDDDLSTGEKKINKKQTTKQQQLNRQISNQIQNNNHQVNVQSNNDNQVDQPDESQSTILSSSNNTISTQQSTNIQAIKQIKSEVKIEPEKLNNKRSNGYHNNYKDRGAYNRPKFQNDYYKQNEYNKQTESKYRGNYVKSNKPYLNNNQLKTANLFPVSHSSSYPKLIQNDVVSSQIWKAFLFLRQTPKSYHRKIELRQILYDALREHFPNNLYVVGSSLNGLGTNTSDVDMCLLLSEEVGEIDQYAQAIPILKIVEDIVRNLDFVDPNKIKLIEAKVPILKFWDKADNIEIDLNINNVVGIRNTQLIRCYTKLDWRFQPLAITVKAWAHRNDIKNAHKKTISSYTLVLMLIHYLQVACSPPVLPCLHKLMPANFQTDSDVRKLSLYEETPEFKSKNDQSLSELFLGFLDYYGNKFDYSQDVISIRQGAIMKKEIAKEFRSSKNTSTQWRFICCEEPFDRTNTARSVSDYESFMRIIRVFKESHEKLLKSRNLLSILNFDHILFNKNTMLTNSNNSLNSLNSDLRSQSTHSIHSIYSTTNSVHSSQNNLLTSSNLSPSSNQETNPISNDNNVCQDNTLTENNLVN